MNYQFDCVVVGSGIAGMTAAIYLKRANVKVLILDNSAPGGLLNKITKIENYPGFKSITGPDLAYAIYEQTINLNIELRYGKALEISENTITTDIEKITTKTILIATGRNAKKLDNTSNLKNVSYCALCDASFYKNKILMLVGNGSAALEEVLHLSEICTKIYLVIRSDKLKGEEILISKILELRNIEIIYDTTISKFNHENDIVKSVDIKNRNIEIDGIFISIGYEPNNDFLTGIEMEKGYIKVNQHMQTNFSNVYACGDIIKKDIYQLTTAASEATVAAVNIIKRLKNL